MDTKEGTNDSLRPEQKEILDGLVRRFFVEGERCLLVEAPTGVGKTRIALEFVREFWRRRGRCRVLVVVPRRVLAHNPWKKEIERWMADLKPGCLILNGLMPPRERTLALSSFHGDILLITAITLNNDFILDRIDLNSSGMIIFDEAHRVVAQGEELGQYRYSVYYKQLALNLIASKEIAVLGLTIPETNRTSETERHLAAVGVTSETAKAPKTETYVMWLDSTHAIKADLWFRGQMWWALNNLRKVLGSKVPWRIDEARLLEILEEGELPEWKYERYIVALRRYRVLYQARQDTWEGNSGRAIERLSRIFREGVPNNMVGLIRGAAYDKLLHVAWLVNRLAREGKKVMVYAKFRQSAHRLQRVLWDEYNMLVETFMGGDPPSKLADLKERAQAVIFTPVVMEGLDLPEFDCLVHISAHSDEFTRRQIRGRIRGGDEYYVVFGDTNDAWKLQIDVPEPEGPLHPVEVEQVKLPITKLDRSIYRVPLEPAPKAPYLTLPVTSLKLLRDDEGFHYALGLLGEAVVAHHYELTGRRVYKLSYSLIRRKRLEGVSGEQLDFIKRLCYVVPNPPIDLVAVGSPTLLIEVKTTAKEADKTTSNVYGRYFNKARSLSLIPTLAVVKARKESNSVIMSVERRTLY
jgi:superfamily II DNA or RNA helicase